MATHTISVVHIRTLALGAVRLEAWSRSGSTWDGTVTAAGCSLKPAAFLSPWQGHLALGALGIGDTTSEFLELGLLRSELCDLIEILLVVCSTLLGLQEALSRGRALSETPAATSVMWIPVHSIGPRTTTTATPSILGGLSPSADDTTSIITERVDQLLAST